MDNQEHKLRLKSLEDIENETNGLVNQISEEKKKTENGIKSVIDNVENCFEYTEKEARNRISELDTKRKDLEDIVQTKLDLASKSLKESIDILKHNYECVRDKYRKSLIIPLASLIFLIFFYESVISYLPWLDYSIYGIPVGKLSIVSLVFLLTWNSLLNLNSSFNINYKHLEKNKEDIDGTNPMIGQISISPQNFEDTKPFFKNAKEVLDNLIVRVGKSTPLIRQAFNDLTLLVKFGERVKSFELALKYYGLLDDEKFFDGLKESPPVYAQIIDDEHVWENSIIEKIIGRLKKQNITISKDIILLLYREHNGFNTTNVFRRILDSDKNLNDIAKILIDSKKLVKPPSGIIYKPQEIVSIIKKVGNFDIREINELLSKSLRLLDYLNSYIEFLHKNRVDPNFKPNIEFIVNELNDENITFEQQVVELAYKVGKIVFGKISSLDDNLVEGFARASISIKFHDERSLRDFACRYSGEDHATAIIKAYYEKAKEIDRKETVSIEELLNNSKLIKDILDDKGKDPGFGFLESQLKEGTWYDSTAAYLKDFFEKKTVEIKEQISNIENFAILKEAMKMTFQKVKIGTVEKAIDAQVFGAYVIMSSSEEGHLMDLVDLLSKRDLSALKEEKRWHLKPPKQIENNKKIYKVTPKYDFMKFSRSTRIGVLQKGESFLEFQNSFLQDLKTILYQKNENFNIGLVIQRITPSKYSFGILDDQDLSDNVDIKNLDVARYIARLASENVPFEEQASIMKFEKDLDLFEIVNMKSMYELIRGKNDDIDYKEKNILESQELKEIIIKELEEKVGSKNFKSLALDLRHSNIRKNEISPIIRDILEKRFLSVLGTRKAKVRANLLSSRFLDALEVLALSYELQQQ